MSAPYHPYLFSEAITEPTDQAAAELSALAKLSQNGFQLAPLVVVPADLEEHFYRLNNLPRQLSQIFKQVDLNDPDEDDVEDAAPGARALLKKHYLLDEVIDIFYGALSALPTKVQVRRAANSRAEGYSATRGRPALMKLKQVWADDWTYDAVLERLESQQTFALEARPILLHAAGDEPAPEERNAAASEVLGQNVTLWEHREYGVTRVYIS